ncbi:DUF3769 domain-containing protein [Prochlorococcus marinus]|uniref:DUF3769 domain-containing protein n=1 Tax=Prochlorococcus marinus TaxID=1219 RepID=UPI001ADBD661|nr:DUF3769 domain-containing protein [Prochlorococcus marinus]MBO8218463.1 DUF3769 domain-containing protein [Prochlorococcus marinus CUG1416]MBW3050871.1 hypothetical protein [Prochlorococcus marinus str. MU1416]
MNSGISKKLIFSTFLFINFIQPGKCADLHKFNNREANIVFQTGSSKILNTKKSSHLSFNNNFENILPKENFLEKNPVLFLAALSEKQEELVIQSDKQSEINDVIYAEGNVSVSYKGKLLKADNLIYNKLNKKISAEGNISFILGDQIFKVSQLEYSFISEKGYLLDVKGSINTNALISDLSSNFSLSDSTKIEELLELKKKEVLNTPGKVDNWLFLTDKMTIDGNKWKSKKAVFSNDLLELKQVKLAVNSLEVISKGDALQFKSSLNYLILDEKVSIPFWFGKRTLAKSEEFLDFENRWTLGYDNLDKDGYFIGRKFNSVDLSDDFVLNLEPQFLIHRSLKGYTKSFVKKGDLITSEKVKRNASFNDYFALKSQIKGRANNWDLEIENNFNSLDVDKFSDAFRSKTSLNKEINFFHSKWNKSFFGIYRDRVWNGSLGEAEIYLGYGSKLQKVNTWVVNGIKKTELLSIGFANIKAEDLNTKNLVTNLKGNLFYSLDQKFPISIDDPKNKSIDISYKYSPEKITKGLILNTRLEALYSFYENGDHQEYIGVGIGPELIMGNLKNKMFDYTRLSLFPFYKIKSGESPFKFDQNYDNFTLNIALDQQLYGPVILKSVGTLNLTNDSDDYGEFIDSKISLNWKKRSYEFGIFYQPHNQAGGISFSLFGFK